LVGAIGEGEEDRPPHPHRDELARLLLERGAEPYDIQVIYNIHFHGRILWWLNLMHEFSVKSGRQADWNDPEWRMLDMGGYGSGALWHMQVAIDNNDPELAEWCLAHGANPNAAPARDPRFAQLSLYEYAVRRRRPEIADLLARYGAEQREVALDDEERFVAACMRMDRKEAQRILQTHLEYLNSPKAMFAAAEEDRADVVALLLDLGTPIEVQDDSEQRALHVAAFHHAIRVAALLIERGAEIDHYELNHSNTPLDCAVYCDHPRMIGLLSRHSRDVWNLTTTGNVDRLREVMEAAPRRAKISWGTTPLFWLPEDENKAIEIVRLFLKHGADAGFRSQQDGSTAADAARKRGMRKAAQDLVTVLERDDEEALQRLGRKFDQLLTFPMVRTNIRRQVERLRNDESAARLELGEAREIIARQSGFQSWKSLLDSMG
jgi:ankyrin repeat protein